MASAAALMARTRDSNIALTTLRTGFLGSMGGGAFVAAGAAAAVAVAWPHWASIAPQSSSASIRVASAFMVSPCILQLCGYEKAAAKPTPITVSTAHQPKTMANAVPRFSLLTQLTPMAA